MHTADPRPALDDILNEIASRPVPPNQREFRAILARFPQFETEITEFVTAWIELEYTRDPDAVTDVDVDRVVNRTMSRVMQVLHETASSRPISNLSGAIRAVGHELDSFERTVGIDRTILTSLESRLIHPASIPALLVKRIASALARNADTVRAYLMLPPQPATAYMADRPPRVRQVGFEEAVRQSTLSETDQTRWLAEPPDPLLARK